MAKLWINYYHFVPCVIELFIAVSDNVSCVFERHAQHTYSHTHFVRPSQCDHIFLSVCVCVLFSSVNAVVTNVVRMKSNDISNFFFFFATKTKRFNFFVGFSNLFDKRANHFCLDLIPFRYIRFPEKLWLKFSILEMKKKRLCSRMTRASALKCWANMMPMTPWKGARAFLLLLAKPFSTAYYISRM